MNENEKHKPRKGCSERFIKKEWFFTCNIVRFGVYKRHVLYIVLRMEVFVNRVGVDYWPCGAAIHIGHVVCSRNTLYVSASDAKCESVASVLELVDVMLRQCSGCIFVSSVFPVLE